MIQCVIATIEAYSIEYRMKLHVCILVVFGVNEIELNSLTPR